MADAPTVPTFRHAFARNRHLDPAAFERVVFVRCLPAWCRPLGFVLIRCVPSWFNRDLQILQDVSGASSLEEVRALSGDFRGGVRHRSSLVRDWLGIRVSGRRVLALACEVMAGPAESGPRQKP